MALMALGQALPPMRNRVGVERLHCTPEGAGVSLDEISTFLRLRGDVIIDCDLPADVPDGKRNDDPTTAAITSRATEALLGSIAAGSAPWLASSRMRSLLRAIPRSGGGLSMFPIWTQRHAR
jgi:hypothetical protein